MDRIIRKELESKQKKIPFVLYECHFDIIKSEPEADDSELKVSMFRSELPPLLLAVGAKEQPENPGKFDYEPEDIKGKCIECDLTHVQDSSGRKIEKLIEIIPFEHIQAKAWDE